MTLHRGANPRDDRRSPQADAWRRLYATKAWRDLRRIQLALHPLCERCKAAGFVVPATVVNHRKPHKGNWTLFADPANHQSVCAPCHDQVIQSEERGGPIKQARTGYSDRVGRDGLPSDPRHPWHAARG